MRIYMHSQHRMTAITLAVFLLAAFALPLRAPQTATADNDGDTSVRSSLEPSEADRGGWEELRALRLSRKLKVMESCRRNGVGEFAPMLDVSEMEAPPAPGPLAYDTGGVEDFEDGVMSTAGYWFAGDLNANDGLVYWDECSNGQGFPVTAYEGTWVGWCADEGGTSWNYYENNMESYLATECEYLGSTTWDDNVFFFQHWVETEAAYDYFEYRIEGFINQPDHGYGIGTPDASYSFQTEQTSGTWELGGTFLNSSFNPCRYLRITFYFYSDDLVHMSYQGAAVDYVELNNLATTAIYPIKGGFPIVGFDTAVGGNFTTGNEWCFMAYWDGNRFKYDNWQYGGTYGWAMGVPFDRAVSAWLYSDTAAGYVEAIQAYKWNLR